jgi:hypothetical protein
MRLAEEHFRIGLRAERLVLPGQRPRVLHWLPDGGHQAILASSSRYSVQPRKSRTYSDKSIKSPDPVATTGCTSAAAALSHARDCGPLSGGRHDRKVVAGIRGHATTQAGRALG